MSDEDRDDSITWLLLLERGRKAGDFDLVARANKELERLGIQVIYCGHHNQAAMNRGSAPSADRPVTLNALVSHLRLPRKWLRAEATAGRIPCLRVGRRLLFSQPAVERALAARAAIGEVVDA